MNSQAHAYKQANEVDELIKAQTDNYLAQLNDLTLKECCGLLLYTRTIETTLKMINIAVKSQMDKLKIVEGEVPKEMTEI